MSATVSTSEIAMLIMKSRKEDGHTEVLAGRAELGCGQRLRLRLQIGDGRSNQLKWKVDGWEELTLCDGAGI